MYFDINFWAVLGAAVASFGLGALWYSPVLFGRQWMKEMGITPERMQKMRLTPAQAMGIGFVATLVTSYVFAHFVIAWGAATVAEGLELGFWIWLGFMAPILLNTILYEEKSLRLFAINAGHLLGSVLLAGGILAHFL